MDPDEDGLIDLLEEIKSITQPNRELAQPIMPEINLEGSAKSNQDKFGPTEGYNRPHVHMPSLNWNKIQAKAKEYFQNTTIIYELGLLPLLENKKTDRIPFLVALVEQIKQDTLYSLIFYIKVSDPSGHAIIMLDLSSYPRRKIKFTPALFSLQLAIENRQLIFSPNKSILLLENVPFISSPSYSIPVVLVKLDEQANPLFGIETLSVL